MSEDKHIYFKTYTELKNKQLELFGYFIHMPQKEYEKMKENEIIGLKIRHNYFIFEEV